MEKRMTSGEIAKKTGVSQKTIRLYDEKGLLKPSGYSEGNYRLYDVEALAVLEKIIALKQIGFSLEEIRENLEIERDVNITEALTRQLRILEEKRNEIEKTIACVKSVLLRQDEPDWDMVAEIVKKMQMDQKADERHHQALLHNAGEDWYVSIYRSLGVQANKKILDLGCGYGKLWRNNWSAIPEGVVIDGYDLYGSWAEDFENFVEQNKAALAVGAGVNLYFEDVEAESTWENIGQRGYYDYIIVHYLVDFMKDVECFLMRVAKALALGGMCSINGAGIDREHTFWQEVFEKLQLKTDFIEERKKRSGTKKDEFWKLLLTYFSKVESVVLVSTMRYTDEVELFTYLRKRYPEAKRYLMENASVLKEYFNSEIRHRKEILIPGSSEFWHCYK